eukprot:6198413-Pleurochrysis_carterae.AAC.3
MRAAALPSDAIGDTAAAATAATAAAAVLDAHATRVAVGGDVNAVANANVASLAFEFRCQAEGGCTHTVCQDEPWVSTCIMEHIRVWGGTGRCTPPPPPPECMENLTAGVGVRVPEPFRAAACARAGRRGAASC